MAMQRNSYNRAERDSRDRDNNSPVRKRVRALDPNDIVDINNIDVLRRFVTEHGKIMPPRLTGVTAAQQRQIKKGVRRARNMGMMA
ncbi:MAG: 30S ribosomal protein S18 [Kiritimatiellae bacterium]|nr:30S ribosomal protein S18 [Kiritimatiellia bacterium]